MDTIKNVDTEPIYMVPSGEYVHYSKYVELGML